MDLALRHKFGLSEPGYRDSAPTMNGHCGNRTAVVTFAVAHRQELFKLCPNLLDVVILFPVSLSPPSGENVEHRP